MWNERVVDIHPDIPSGHSSTGKQTSVCPSSLRFDSSPFGEVVITMNDRVGALALENAEHFRHFGFKTLARHCEDAGPLLGRLEK